MDQQPDGSKMISVIIPVYNSAATLPRCLEAVLSSNYAPYECIVVDDGSSDGSQEIARRYPVRVVESPKRAAGPADARNRGAELARGEYLFFIDADVIVPPDSLAKVAATFEKHTDVAAIFGSYDENPGDREFLSQYKNLVHHFVHQRGHEDASTFWSGCGAIRRERFCEIGGFDAKQYRRPSIEDIELGYRLKAAGHKILLQKDIQVTHLKRWSLGGLLKADISYRAVPWTLLILKDRNLPNDLNLQSSQRLTTLLVVMQLLHLVLLAFTTSIIVVLPLTTLFLLLVSSWHWEERTPFFQMSQGKQRLAFALIGLIYVLALYSDETQLLPPFVLLLPILIAAAYLLSIRPLFRHTLFWAMMLIVAAEYALLFTGYPLLLVAPQLVFILLIVSINYRLYLFLASKRGVVFAVAALPLQILYYLYSGIAFLIGSGIHFLRANPRAE
jgi:glycosyltransferase involved in cell wall biosynthesis